MKGHEGSKRQLHVILGGEIYAGGVSGQSSQHQNDSGVVRARRSAGLAVGGRRVLPTGHLPSTALPPAYPEARSARAAASPQAEKQKPAGPRTGGFVVSGIA